MPNDNVLTDAAITACALMIKGICLTKPSDEWTAQIEKRIRFMLSTAGSPTLTSGQPEPRAEVTGWQPIETAPKETELLGWRADCGVLLIMYTSFDRWASEAECEEIDEETLFQKDWFGTALPGIMDRLEGEQVPTHWMSLPAEPGDAARTGASS